MLHQIRAIVGADVKIALLWDNCAIHHATIVREAAAAEDVNIELVFNNPYRPDLAPIELYFAEVKRRYRRQLDKLKAYALPFDHTRLV